jgi:chemotaxis protein methyltransferase CheR
MRESEFAALLDRFALSPEGYRKVRKGVQKRIVRHMQALRCPSMKAYLERLDTDGAAERRARRLMEEEILPSLIADHPGGLRVWSAGCALGQEVYSFRILWALLAEKTRAMPPLDLQATDVNPAYLERAIEGIYPAGALARVLAEAMVRFFRPAGRASFRVADGLRGGIRWQVHDLTVDAPPERDFQILFLRNNLLTYCRDEVVKAALPAIADCLVPGGYLVIGRKEQLPDSLKGFHPFRSESCLYRKQASNGMA